MWRAGVLNRNAADRLDFQLSTDATSLTTGTWVDYDSLDFNSPNLIATAGALNGNAAANQTSVSFSITGLSIAQRRVLLDPLDGFRHHAGSDDGLAVDDFSLTPRVVDLAPRSSTPSRTTGRPTSRSMPTSRSRSASRSTSRRRGSRCPARTSGNGRHDLQRRTDHLHARPRRTLVERRDLHADGARRTRSAIRTRNDPPDNMVVNFMVGFTAVRRLRRRRTRPSTRSRAAGCAPPIPGTVTTKGVVVGDFEGSAGQQGFYLQDLTGDGDPATSDGIFVFTGSSNLVSAGQVVRVTGFARERFNQTTLNGSNSNTAAVPGGQHRALRHRHA